MRNLLIFIPLFCIFGVILGKSKSTFVLDERWVCNLKHSCTDCLRLPQCSWCGSESRCFSVAISGMEEYCKDNVTHNTDYGMSLEANAECACYGAELEQNCHPPGDEDGVECSNRGKCECGRCVCDQTPDPDHPSKNIMGDYCEFDNFSCDGPWCNEGPYNINYLDVEDPAPPAI